MNRDVTLILGTDGTGKSTLADKLSKKSSRVLVLDAGFSQFKAEHVGNIDAAAARLGALRAYGTNAPFRLSFTPLPDEYDLCFALARELGECTIIAEEADRFDEMGIYQQEYVYRGRHWGVSIIAVTIQPYALPKDLRRIVREVYAFRMTEQSDLDYLAGIVGEAAYEVPSLRGPGRGTVPPYDFLHWEVGHEAKIVRPGRSSSTAVTEGPQVDLAEIRPELRGETSLPPGDDSPAYVRLDDENGRIA